jgi:hypothetical protein
LRVLHDLCEVVFSQLSDGRVRGIHGISSFFPSSSTRWSGLLRMVFREKEKRLKEHKEGKKGEEQYKAKFEKSGRRTKENKNAQEMKKDETQIKQ